MGLAIPLEGFEDFKTYLKTHKKSSNVRQIICYAKRYHNVLETGDASAIVSLPSAAMRHHIMESLAAYSKYCGKYDKWQQIRKQYLLKWTSGNESLETMHRFFNPDLTLDGMLQRIKEMIVNTPTPIAEIVKFGCCVGLRSAEIVESVRLINDREAFPKYYDSVQMTLCHYKFKQFLRSTKKAFLSYITPQALEPIQNLTKVPTYSSIRHICNRRRMPCNLHLCRKVFASWLHESGFSDITIDMLQGRCPQSVLAQHYISPNASLRDKVLQAIHQLKEKIS